MMNCMQTSFNCRSFKSWRGAARSVIFIAAILLVLQIAMFAEGLSRTYGTEGLKGLFSNWGPSLGRLDTWVHATVQALLSIPLSSGIMVTLAGAEIYLDIGIEYFETDLV